MSQNKIEYFMFNDTEDGVLLEAVPSRSGNSYYVTELSKRRLDNRISFTTPVCYSAERMINWMESIGYRHIGNLESEV